MKDVAAVLNTSALTLPVAYENEMAKYMPCCGLPCLPSWRHRDRWNKNEANEPEAITARYFHDLVYSFVSPNIFVHPFVRRSSHV